MTAIIAKSDVASEVTKPSARVTNAAAFVLIETSGTALSRDVVFFNPFFPIFLLFGHNASHCDSDSNAAVFVQILQEVYLCID